MAYPIKISAMSGVHGDGVADDSAAITAALAQAAQTPNGVVLIDGKYYFNKPITVPAGVTVLGYGRAGEIVDKSPQDTHDADASNYFSTLGSVLYYGSNATLVLSARTSLRQANLIGVGAKTFAAAGTDVQAYIKNNFLATAVQTGPDGYDVTIEDVLAVGFLQAFKTYGGGPNERISITRFFADAINGFDLSMLTDVCRFRDLHCWGYWSNHQSFPNGGYRSGIAFNLHDKLDGCMFSGLFSYGYKTGIRLASTQSTTDVWAAKLDGCIVDNDIGMQATYPCTGIATSGIVRQTTFTGCHADSCDVNWDLEHGVGHGRNVLIGCSSGQARTSKLQLGSGDGSIVGFSSEGDALYEITALAGVGHWRIDNYSAINNSKLALFFNAPGPNGYADLANLDCGYVSGSNLLVTFDPTSLTSYVDASSSGDQGVQAARFSAVNLTTKNHDSFSEFSGSVFSPKIAGLYEITYGFGASQAAGTPAQTAFYLGKNGSSEIVASRSSLPVATTTIVTGGRTVVVNLAVGDTVGLYAYLDNGGTLYSGRMTLQARRVVG